MNFFHEYLRSFRRKQGMNMTKIAIERMSCHPFSHVFWDAKWDGGLARVALRSLYWDLLTFTRIFHSSSFSSPESLICIVVDLDWFSRPRTILSQGWSLVPFISPDVWTQGQQVQQCAIVECLQKKIIRLKTPNNHKPVWQQQGSFEHYVAR